MEKEKKKSEALTRGARTVEPQTHKPVGYIGAYTTLFHGVTHDHEVLYTTCWLTEPPPKPPPPQVVYQNLIPAL